MYLLSILGTTLIYYQSTGRYFPSYLLGGQLSPQFPFALGLALAPENPVAHQPISPATHAGVCNANKGSKNQAMANKPPSACQQIHVDTGKTTQKKTQ